MVRGAMARSRWIALAVLSATFIAGAAAGAAAFRVLAGDRAEQAPPRPDSRRGERGPERPSIFDQMGLTAEQKTAMDSVMEKRRREMDAFWSQHNPEVRAIIDSTRAEIDRLLTPEQRKKFEEFRERRRRDHPGWEGREGPRPEPGDSARRTMSFYEPRYL